MVLGLISLPARLVAQMVKHLSTMWETWVQSLGQEDSLEKEMATHSSTLAQKIPWSEEPSIHGVAKSRTRLSDFTSLSLLKIAYIVVLFCIHSASLCLLVGVVNPLTFKVIINKYDPIAIYIAALGSIL